MGKPKDSDGNLSQRHFFHHKFHTDRPASETGPPRLEDGDWSSEELQGQRETNFSAWWLSCPGVHTAAKDTGKTFIVFGL